MVYNIRFSQLAYNMWKLSVYTHLVKQTDCTIFKYASKKEDAVKPVK